MVKRHRSCLANRFLHRLTPRPIWALEVQMVKDPGSPQRHKWRPIRGQVLGSIVRLGGRPADHDHHPTQNHRAETAGMRPIIFPRSCIFPSRCYKARGKKSKEIVFRSCYCRQIQPVWKWTIGPPLLLHSENDKRKERSPNWCYVSPESIDSKGISFAFVSSVKA